MRVSGSRRGGSGKRKRSRLNWLARGVMFALAGFYSLITLSLIALKWVNPPTTAVQAERRLQSWIHRSSYSKVYAFVPLAHISPTLQHAAVAAEDARFFQHHGFDWKEVRIAVKSDLNEGKSRGASTITQQLVKNLFLSTSRSFLRKGIEFTIVPLAEFILSKNRILELYLNVIEWGPGVYGAEAAAQHYFRIPARQLTREEAVELASILPAPLHRKPGRLTEYEHVISERMAQMGW
jgi:monofunctional biosynthetic peptidoglycan transglycosylase